jgi:anti-anti-sigma factor
MGDGRFPFEMGNGVPVVAAPEEIDITSAPALRSALLEAAAHGHGTLVADMILTQFCDSSGLHALLAAGSCCWSPPPLPSSAFSRSPAWTV